MNIVFNSDFLEDIKKLGNSVKLVKYYLEDALSNEIHGHTLKDIIDLYEYNPKTYYGQRDNDDTYVRGIWDKDRKEFITHISLPDFVVANTVRRDIDTDEPIELQYEHVDEITGKKTGDDLIRVIRFVYDEKVGGAVGTTYKTAFLLTGDISGVRGDYIIDPIRINQDRNVIVISFPENTRANIIPYTVEKDTKFLETYGLDPGINIFLNSDEESLVSRDSYFKYLRVYTGDLQNFQTPYVDSSGKEISKNYIYRDYKKLNIDCAGLFKYSTPNTKISLSRDGGLINIYGSAEYDEYILLGNELKYLGSGTEAIENIPNVDIEFSGNGTLKDVKLDTGIVTVGEEVPTDFFTEVNKFRVSYGRYEGQEDPSKLINFKLKFYDPFLNVTKEVQSKKIKITQLDEILNEWELFDRTTEYFENNKPVYMFPWQEQSMQHSFKVRTCLSNLRITDFIMTYENECLNELFSYNISFEREYPYYIYTITLTNNTTNEDIERWLPIIDEESTLLLATLSLNGYEYEEPFYMVQGPKVENIELHSLPNNDNVESINFTTIETERIYYPVAPEANTINDIGIRDTWKVLSCDDEVVVEPISGMLNPNSVRDITSGLRITIEREPETMEPLVFDDLVLGRIKENESNFELTELNWRDVISLSKVSIPISKDGLAAHLIVPEQLTFSEINLYRVDIQTNSPVTCRLSYEEGFERKFLFYDPYNNRIVDSYTRTSSENTFYNSDPQMPIYLALVDLDTVVDELILVGRLDITATNEEYGTNITRSCSLYQGPHEGMIDYIDDNGRSCYVFLDSNVRTPVKYLSTRTPERIIENLPQDPEANNYIPYSNIVMVNQDPIVNMNLDGYQYHSDLLQNPNSLSGLYPISPSAIFSASQQYYDYYNKIGFYVFRKALGPGIYFDGSNTVYVPAIGGSEVIHPIEITIKSRYRIKQEDFVKYLVNEDIDFEARVQEEELTEDDNYNYEYRYEYRLSFLALSNNTGSQRTVGTFTITSRIYEESFINLNSINTDSSIPYYDFSQEEIDRIVSPESIVFTIIQIGESGSNNGNIHIVPVGTSDYNIDVYGEVRSFRITADVPVNEPELTTTNCEVNSQTSSGFSIKVSAIYFGFVPCNPEDVEQYSYISEGRGVTIDAEISPTDPMYDTYTEQLLYHQSGIDTGIVFGREAEYSSLYIGNNNYRVTETISGSITQFQAYLGLFSIVDGISVGQTGSISNLEITSEDPTNNYEIVNRQDIIWNPDQHRASNIKFTFPVNNTNNTVNRVYTIVYKVNDVIIHKITFIIKQQSASIGSLTCNNNMYVLSHGECLNSDIDNLGWFDFETEIPLRQLSVELVTSNLLESNPTIQEISSGRYRVYIKLKPNLTEDIKTTILNFVKNGSDIVKSVSVSQGYYCAKLYYPEEADKYIIDGGSIGSTSNYIDTPTRDETQIGTLKTFKIAVSRKEPTINGEWVVTENLINDVDFSVLSYTWSLLGVDRPAGESSSSGGSSFVVGGRAASNSNSGGDINSNNTIIGTNNNNNNTNNTNNNIVGGRSLQNIISDYFSRYNTLKEIIDDTPYLKNTYIVYDQYYRYGIRNKVNVTLKIYYPINDILKTYYITPVFNIFQNKLAE